MATKDKIRKILEGKFSLEHLEITDDSARHKGHAEAKKSGGGHFSVVIVSDDFKGKPLVERHRMVYQALADLKSQIHALALKAATAEEFLR